MPPDLQETVRAIGQRLPPLWQSSVLSNAQKKAFLRGLIDTVVIHRSAHDEVTTRIVWKGGTVTMRQISLPGGSLADLSFAKEMEQEIRELAHQHVSDEQIATRFTEKGYRSPMRSVVLPSIVQKIRLSHGILHKAHQSPPRKVPGYLSVAQIAQQIGVSVHWVSDRIHNGRIRIVNDPRVRGSLFPDNSTILDPLRLLKHGDVSQVLVNDTSEPVPDSSEQVESARSYPKTTECS